MTCGRKVEGNEKVHTHIDKHKSVYGGWRGHTCEISTVHCVYY